MKALPPETDQHQYSQEEERYADYMVYGKFQVEDMDGHCLFIEPEKIDAKPRHGIQKNKEPEGESVKLPETLTDKESTKDDQTVEGRVQLCRMNVLVGEKVSRRTFWRKDDTPWKITRFSETTSV